MFPLREVIHCYLPHSHTIETCSLYSKFYNNLLITEYSHHSRKYRYWYSKDSIK